MRSLRSFFLSLVALSALPAFAQDFYAGGQLGAVGSGDSSNIGYGLQLGTNPSGIASFQLDFTFANPTGGTYFSSSPAIIIYPINYEEFSFGLMAGGGFYKFPDMATKFGFNIGATGDFHLTKLLSVGMETRYHWVLSTDDVWTAFLVLRFHFEGDGGW